MAVSSGFYNSVNGDRKYNALQMSSIFDGIIEDGVYNSIGDRFSLTAGKEGNTVVVGTGRAWFNHSWILNDADYPLEIEPAEVVLDRYDAIVIEINGSNAVRNNLIKVIKGTAGSSPSKPSMAKGDNNIWQHPLGYIYVPAGASSISQSNIEYVVGTSECPFVVAAVQSVDIDALVAQWSDQFNTWFDNLETQLDGDVAGNLQNQINQKVDKANVIDNLNDLVANQADGMIAGAKAVAELNDDLFFRPGDTISLQYVVCNGFLTSDGTVLYVTIPVGKRLDYITGAMTQNTFAYLRQDGNYIGDSNSSRPHGFAWDQGGFYINKDTGTLRFRYEFSTRPKNGKNNDMVSAYFTDGVIVLS